MATLMPLTVRGDWGIGHHGHLLVDHLTSRGSIYPPQLSTTGGVFSCNNDAFSI